jgi:hypothetical protein
MTDDSINNPSDLIDTVHEQRRAITLERRGLLEREFLKLACITRTRNLNTT